MCVFKMFLEHIMKLLYHRARIALQTTVGAGAVVPTKLGMYIHCYYGQD